MKRIIFYILLAIFILPLTSSAQGEPGLLDPVPDSYKLLAPLPCIEGPDTTCNAGELVEEMDISSYINYIFKFFIAAAAFLAIIMIIYGGIQYMVSEVPFVKTNAKSTITNAFAGLAMVLVSYLLLATIDPRLVEIETTIKPVTVDTSALLKFRVDLEKDLETLTQETRLGVIESQNKINNLESVSKELKARYDRGEIDEEEYSIENAIIEKDKKDLNISIVKDTARGTGVIWLDKAVGLISTTQNFYVANEGGFTYANPTDEAKQKIDEFVSSINTSYPKHIEKLKEYQDYEGAAKLEEEKEFFIKEIETQKHIIGTILAYKSGRDPIHRNNLENNASNYRKSLSSLDNLPEDDNSIYKDPKINSAYKSLLQSRVDMIESALK